MGDQNFFFPFTFKSDGKIYLILERSMNDLLVKFFLKNLLHFSETTLFCHALPLTPFFSVFYEIE